MKAIKLSSNAVAGKDYTLEVPVVVKPAVVRYVSRNLKDLAKSNPDFTIRYTDEEYENLPANIKQKLEDPDTGLLTNNVVEVEQLFNPAEFFKGMGPADVFSDLFLKGLSGIEDLTESLTSEGVSTIEIAGEIEAQSSTSEPLHKNYTAVKMPITWFINNKENLADLAAAESHVSNEVPNISVEDLGGGDGSMGITIDSFPEDKDIVFLLTAQLSVQGATFYENIGDADGVQENDPSTSTWKAEFPFEVVIHKTA